jgi:secretion/DNA translocation related TadE-like protein
MIRRRADGQQGSASVVVVAIVAMVVVLGMAAADVARVLVAAAGAQTAADAAALAAAQELALPSDVEPIDAATEYAARNGATLLECGCERGELSAVVQVRVEVGRLLLFGTGRSVGAEAAAEVGAGDAPRPAGRSPVMGP